VSDDDIDPQLPFIQVARGVAAKAARLAGNCGADYYRVRGVLDAFWESLADRRVLRAALEGPGCVVVTTETVLAALCRPLGCAPEDVVTAGFLAPFEPEKYRVRGMSRYLSSERTRLNRKAPRKRPGLPPNTSSTPVGPQSDPPSTLVEPHRGKRVEGRGERVEVRGEETLPFEPDGPNGGLGSGSKSGRKPDPRHAPLVAALVAAGATVTRRHVRAVSELLELATQATDREHAADEVLARWRRALAHQGYPTVREVGELAKHWGHFAPPRDTIADTWAGTESGDIAL
jgi:hypothetical protein